MTIVTLQPGSSGKDTEITSLSGNQGNNFGARTDFHVGTASGAQWKALVEFDLSSLPPGVIITSATLSLYCANEESSRDDAITVRRGLTQWFEGVKNGSAPDAGQDGSTWSHRNANGSISWGAAGGLEGTDYATTPTDTTPVTGTGVFIDWDVTVDVQGFVNSSFTNFGWWFIRPDSVNGHRKFFTSSDSATAAQRPKLVIDYELPTIAATVAGTCTVTGTLKGKTSLEANAAGSSVVTATIISNQNIIASAQGTSTVTGFLRARVYIKGNAFGDSTAVADIKASYHSVGTAAGTSTHVAHLKGKFRMEGLAEGVGLLLATPSFQGQLRGSAHGTSEATAVGYARARSVALVIGCNPVPLFYITNGSVKPNGQLDTLNFLGDKSGFFLRNYRPQIAPYKDGGRFSSSPQSQGRRLRSRVFDNAIDILELAAHGFDQDALIEYQQDLIAFQEAAADYWTSEFSFSPYYLVARGARETKIRYAIIHLMSVPELENPYAQPFFDHTGAAFESLTVRIERGIWLSSPPGSSEECVAASGQREWTVSGWATGV